MIKHLAIALAVFLPVPLAIVGATESNIWCIYLMLIVVLGLVGIIGFTNLIPKFYYPFAIFFIGLGLLYQTTYISPYLVGTDIHSEYYYFKNALDGWDLSLAGNYNTAIGITLLAPFLTNYLHIPGVWIFKAVYPFIFAFVPLLLYLGYKNFVDHKQAFLSAFFFISVPMFMLEVIGITKLQLSGFCIAFLIFLVFYKGWNWKLRLGLAIPITVLVALFHYSTGYVLLYFLGVGAVVFVIFRLLKLGKPGMSMVIPIVITLILAGGIFAYFSAIGSSLSNPTNWVEPSKYVPPLTAQVVTHQEPLIKTALGLDIMGASSWGKLFRIFQLVTEAFIIVGFFHVMINSRKHKAVPTEFLAFCTAGLLLLAACIWLPEFSRLLNVSRFYHIALYFVSPLVVIGGVYAFKWAKRHAVPIVTSILMVYFIFTSGVVFEATKQPDVSKFDMPYSIALSHNRIDMAAIFTEQDYNALEWVSANRGDHIIYADIHGKILLLEWIELDNEIGYLPVDLSLVPNDAWIFLREWNQENKMLTYHAGIGLRKSVSANHLGLDSLLDGRQVVYSFGYDDHQAYIYGSKEE